MTWETKRKHPYTATGIGRLKCIRCGKQAMFQWQICSDGNTYRPLCVVCDVDLNQMVLEWMGHPNSKKLVDEYKNKKLG